MTISYAVAEKRSGRALRFASRGDRVTSTWTNEYQVTVSATGSDSVSDASPYDVISATGLPVVNSSVYYFNSEVIPFLVCRNKHAKQSPKNQALWTVSCEYQSFDGSQTESGNQPKSPPATLDLLGTSEQAELGEFEKVLYEDKSTTAVPIRLPSGAYFAEPVTERIPTLTIKLTQYESNITYEQMLARKFKVNDGTYRTQAAGTWLIENVEASTVSVQLSGGATTAALVTYTIRHSPLDEGWEKSLALIDYKHNTGTAMSPAYEWNLEGDQLAATLTFVDSDGIKTGSSTPDYADFKVYDEIDFDSFLLA
jgi:hypothetical protein